MQCDKVGVELAGAAAVGLLVVAGRLPEYHLLHWTHVIKESKMLYGIG